MPSVSGVVGGERLCLAEASGFQFFGADAERIDQVLADVLGPALGQFLIVAVFAAIVGVSGDQDLRSLIFPDEVCRVFKVVVICRTDVGFVVVEFD